VLVKTKILAGIASTCLQIEIVLVVIGISWYTHTPFL